MIEPVPTNNSNCCCVQHNGGGFRCEGAEMAEFTC